MKKRKERTLTLYVTTIKEFEGDLSAFVYDRQGNLITHNQVRKGKVELKVSEKQAFSSRIFIAPQLPESQEVPTLNLMERINAYEPVIKPGLQAEIQENIRIPGSVTDFWNLCFCWVKGRVLKDSSNLPICGARVHICEVDNLPRFIGKLPDRDILRLRDDLLRELTVRPNIPEPPRPQPDPPPFRPDLTRAVEFEANQFRFNPQPEPPPSQLSLLNQIQPTDLPSSIDNRLQARLTSNSATVLRNALLNNIDLLKPFWCLWPWWWRLNCKEIRLLETDSSGRFETILIYLCNKDKPDLYFWVEYNINGTWETVYKPPLACNTYWNYSCGTEVNIHISDERVAACDPEPDLSGCLVQILSIGRNVSMSEIEGPGASLANEGLTTNGQPFGGKLEPRIWFSRSSLIEDKNITHYRWSFRRLSEGDGTPLPTPGAWTPLSRTVVRHFAKPIPGGGITHEPVIMGPETKGSESNLFKIKPMDVPDGGIEWTVVDEREDLASGHFQSQQLGTGEDSCTKAFNAAGHYELKLELFKNDGSLVNWTQESVDLHISDVPAPFGTDPVTAVEAGNYYRITNSDGDTMGFRMVLRVDNNCCEAEVKPITGTGLTISSCGFVEFDPGATVDLKFKASHPNGFANLDFNLTRGVSDPVGLASASGKVGISASPYAVSSGDNYEATFPVTDLLGTCDRAAFAENLHVRTLAQNGYNSLSGLNRSDAAGFALTAPCPDCDCEDEEN